MGVFPKHWQIVDVGSLNPFVTSGSRGWARFYAETGAPFIRISNLTRQSIDLDLSSLKAVLLSPQGNAEASRTQLQDGDILISITADIGIVGIVDSRVSKPAYMNQHIALIRFDKTLVCARFVAYSLASERPQRLFVASMDIGAKAGMSLLTVRKIRLALPPFPEQRAIAEALSDVDKLLGSLEKLIAKKRAIKQATMQQLLTGKTRLPGFSGAWETRRLGSLGAFSKGRGITREDISDSGLPCVRYGELYTRYEDYVFNLTTRIPSAVASTALPIKTGDLLFAGSGETAEEIGRCAAYVGAEQAYAGGDIVVLTPVGQNSIYLGHLMNYRTVVIQKARMGQGDAVVHISASNLAQVKLSLPPVEEQRAIATVLSDMDAEIAVLERRRDKTRAIKQAMMQQLLTGRVRLIVPHQMTASA
ncbi:MAG: restriction endonuclease subunit S [Desulfurellaceae bacterium]|nr:restriction endonuclease subunit S [Desulfurellaceae bacterium]